MSQILEHLSVEYVSSTVCVETALSGDFHFSKKHVSCILEQSTEISVETSFAFSNTTHNRQKTRKTRKHENALSCFVLVIFVFGVPFCPTFLCWCFDDFHLSVPFCPTFLCWCFDDLIK